MNAATKPSVLAIAMIPVDSHLFSAYGYDADSRTLAVQFPDRGDRPGDVYHYFDFPADVWAEFQQAESKGKFFGARVKGIYRFEKQPGADGIVFGLSQTQEPKYTVSQRDGRILNRATGKPIPDDEPIFVLRAKDVHASAALAAYLAEIGDIEHRAAVQARIDAFDAFAAAHPERMKVPDTATA